MPISDEANRYKENTPPRTDLLFIFRSLTNMGPFEVAGKCVSFAVTLAFVALLSLNARADGSVVRKGDRLSVDFHALPLRQVVEALKRTARIVVRMPATPRDPTVTVTFHDLEIGAAMDRLLKSASLRSSAIVYDPGPQGWITIVVVAAGTSASTNAPARVADSPTAPSMDPAIAHDGEPLTPRMRQMLTPTPAAQSDAPAMDVPDPDAPVSNRAGSQESDD